MVSALQILDAGRGTTPVPEGARFQLGARVSVLVDGVRVPAHVVAVVPPGVSPSVALADQTGQPRPLAQAVNRKKKITYVIHLEGDRSGNRHWIHERDLQPMEAA